MITYRLRHPNLTEPLDMDSEVQRTDRALTAWATMWVLREYDEVLPREGWTVEVVQPEGRPCVVDHNRDGLTLWDCTCRECLAIQRDWYRTNGDEA
jgi:hypothetical protein